MRRTRSATHAIPGNWQLVPAAVAETDALTELEHCRERVHLLLDRYGLITRELANRESPRLRWSQLFKALRVMELSGEVLQGHFIDGLSGPQFITQRALSRLLQGNNAPGFFWCSAVDPVSPCGLGLDWPELPQRRAANFLSFRSGKLALVVENNGKRLQFHNTDAVATRAEDRTELNALEIAAENATDNDIDQILAPVIHIAKTRGRVRVDSINGEPTRGSPYRAALARVLKQRSDHRHVWYEV